MKITTYHVDAFTDQLFSGNPAAVCIMEQSLPDALLQKIAAENNLPATAFIIREADKLTIRWFGPEYEIDLCGHGTLASGYIIFNYLEPTWHEVNFHHPQVGLLQVRRNESFIVLDFPVKTFNPYTSSLLEEGLRAKPKAAYEFKKERILVVLDDEMKVKQLHPDIQILKQLEHRGIIVTAKGETVDFVSRVFYPKKTLYEDAVTGSSYCLLVPYWANQLNKTEFHAYQLSQRGGEVRCELKDHRVILYGKGVLYKKGEIELDPEKISVM